MAFGLTTVISSPQFVAACGKAAPIVSSGVFLSPVPTVLNIMKDRSVGNLPLLPYSSMCVNAFMWMTYGENLLVCLYSFINNPFQYSS